MVDHFVAWLLLLVHSFFIDFIFGPHAFGLVWLHIYHLFASLLLEYFPKRGVTDRNII